MREQSLGETDESASYRIEPLIREILPVQLEGGQRYRAWVYVFHVERLPALEKSAVELKDGDWKDYL